MHAMKNNEKQIGEMNNEWFFQRRRKIFFDNQQNN